MTSSKDSEDPKSTADKKAASRLSAEQAEELSASIKPSWDRFFGDQASDSGDDERGPASRPDADKERAAVEDAPTEVLDSNDSDAPSGGSMLRMAADESRGKTILVDEHDEEIPDSEEPPWPKAPPPEDAAAEEKTTASAAADEPDPLQKTVALATKDDGDDGAAKTSDGASQPRPTEVLPAASWPPEARPADSQDSEPPPAAADSADEAPAAALPSAPIARAAAAASFGEEMPDFSDAEDSIRVPTNQRPWGKALAIGAGTVIIVALVWFVGSRAGGSESESTSTTAPTGQALPPEPTATPAATDTVSAEATASAEASDEADAAAEAEADSGSETTAPSAEPTAAPTAAPEPPPPPVPPPPRTTAPPKPPPPRPTGDGIVRELPF